MQVAGQAVVENLTELHAAAQVAAHVRDAQRSARSVRATVAQLARAAKHLQADDLHLALTVLNDVQKANPLRTPQAPCSHLSPGRHLGGARGLVDTLEHTRELGPALV
jgi:hypothetical protein